MTSVTEVRTLYRLKGVKPTIEAMTDALDEKRLTAMHSQSIEILSETLGVPSIAVHGTFAKAEAGWCPTLRRTTGLDVSLPSRDPAALVVLAVDEVVYAIAHGRMGHRLIPDHIKDKVFGREFASRRVDASQINDLGRQTLGLGRTDISLVPGGAPVQTFGIEEHAQIIRTIGGRLNDVRLTVSNRSRAQVSSVYGGVGLRIHLGVDGHDLLSDLREITRVCTEERPHPDLEFIEYILPVTDAELIPHLESALDDILGDPDEGRVAGAVPQDHWDDYLATRRYRFQINSIESHVTDDFDLAYILDRLRAQRPGRRVRALRNGTVVLYSDGRARNDDKIWACSAFRWIEADVALGNRRFFLLDGDWFEIGPGYLSTIRAKVQKMIASALSDDMLAWDLAHDEHRYCEDIEDQGRGYLCMDAKFIKTPLHSSGRGLEVCDVLCPDNALTMIKRAKRAGALSHLCNQVLVAVQALLHDPDAVPEFRRKVTAAPGGRSLPENFRPRTVRLAILLKDGRELNADTLFPFAQVAIVSMARVLNSWGINVELVGVRGRACTCAKAA